MIWRKFKIAIIATLVFATGCKVQYSFTGINVNADSMTINSFFNDADGGPPDLAQTFTDMMRDYFQQNTSLQLTDNGGDLLFEGAVTGYRLTPVSPQASGTGNRQEFTTSAQTRLTITVSVNYTNVNNPETDFTKNFSFFSDFDADQQVSDIEEELIEEIYEQILLNIFNESVANW